VKYTSRKKVAEGRLRLKGRFVKQKEHAAIIELLYGSQDKAPADLEKIQADLNEYVQKERDKEMERVLGKRVREGKDRHC